MVDVGSNRFHDITHRCCSPLKKSGYMDEPYVFSVVQALSTGRTSPCSRRMSDPGGRHRAVACIPHEYFVASGAPGVATNERGASTQAGGVYSSSSSDTEIEETDNVFQCGGKEQPSSPAHQALFNQERARYRWSVPLLPAAAFTARRRSRASSLPRLDVPLLETSEEQEDCDSTDDTLGKGMDADQVYQRIRGVVRPRYGRTLRQHSASRRRHSESMSLEVISEDSDWFPPATTATSRRFSCSPNSG